MIQLFAEATTPNANAIWFVTVALVSVLGNIAQFGMWMSMRKRGQTEIFPRPLVVAMEKEFARLHLFEEAMKENKREHENLFSKIGGVERGAASRLEQQLSAMRQEDREERSKLHGKISEARESIAGLEKETELQNQRMAQMDSKLDRLIERS